MRLLKIVLEKSLYTQLYELHLKFDVGNGAQVMWFHTESQYLDRLEETIEILKKNNPGIMCETLI